ncbi:MAG: rhodoquinone biosynthesis methyltransferase RquA [Betaproteobacteria bacterium]|nr:rhodoquinone biosynthesis methyltransferase RquA [Betaproteobacteria bacterium]MCL2886982.1 rhodoquinone biosynthesis methyltransferase RquA [Betaproteobacteria bacterium]
MSKNSDSSTLEVPDQKNLPAYMTEVYGWAYIDPQKVHWLDRNLVFRVLLFFNDKRLTRAYLDEIEPGMRVWQVAHVYGDLIRQVADKVGAQGVLHLTDIAPIQIKQAERKLADRPWCKATHCDAVDFTGEKGIDYDIICSFFLLHEVPDDKKRQIVDHMLGKLPKGGKAIFVDYSNPARWQPVRYILKTVNHFLEPFSNALWENEINHYASNAGEFTWEKKTFFGGVYQCITVRHKQA